MTETDPNGLSAKDPGSKLDFGKNRLGIVLGGFADALWEVGKVGTFGANKYTPNGWMTLDDGLNRYSDAMLRHYLKEQMGELYDEESGMYHAAQVAWNALARLSFILREQAAKEKNDQPSIEPNDSVESSRVPNVQTDLRSTYWGDRPETISHGSVSSGN